MASIAIFALLMAASLILSALCSASETAAFQIGPSDVRALQGHGRVHRAISWIVEHRRRTLVTVLLLNLVINLFYMNLGQAVAELVGANFGPQARILTDCAVLLILVAAGDIFPKIIAVRRPRAVVALTAVPLYLAERALRLPRIALTAVSDALMRLIGVHEEEGDVTPAELQEVLKVAATKGQLAMDEHEWLRALLELDDVHVKEIIVPRVEMTSFDLRQGRSAFLEQFVRTRRNKIPVHEGNVDGIKGYLNAKDVLSLPDKPLAELVRPVIFIPESASIAAAMQQMQSGGRRLAIVVDEYGGTEGLFTQEDLVESVVGDLADESEDRWEPVREIEPGVFLVDAALPIHALRRIIGPRPIQRGIATVGGLVSAELERLPRMGDKIALGRVSIEIAAMRGKRPDRLLLRYDRTASEHVS
jgi:putative hemolysin